MSRSGSTAPSTIRLPAGEYKPTAKRARAIARSKGCPLYRAGRRVLKLDRIGRGRCAPAQYRRRRRCRHLLRRPLLPRVSRTVARRRRLAEPMLWNARAERAWPDRPPRPEQDQQRTASRPIQCCRPLTANACLLSIRPMAMLAIEAGWPTRLRFAEMLATAKREEAGRRNHRTAPSRRGGRLETQGCIPDEALADVTLSRSAKHGQPTYWRLSTASIASPA